MNKKEYLIDALIDRAHVITLTAKTATPDELADELIGFMAAVSLLGESGIVAPRTPQQAEAKLVEQADLIASKFEGDWNQVATD